MRKFTVFRGSFAFEYMCPKLSTCFPYVFLLVFVFAVNEDKDIFFVNIKVFYFPVGDAFLPCLPCFKTQECFLQCLRKE